MNIKRGNWTNEEDQILKETVERFMAEGATQLAAFDEAARLIQRSPGACAFRWNSKLRKETGRESAAVAPAASAATNAGQRAEREDLIPFPELLACLQAYDRQLQDLRQIVLQRDNEIARLKEQLKLNIPPEELKKLLDILQSRSAG